MTVDSFNAWRIRFTAEMKQLKLKEEEDRLKSLPPKERDEAKRMATKLTGAPETSCTVLYHALTFGLTGKAMFERNRNLDNVDEANADGTDIDLSKYERTAEQEESDEEGSLVLSDSD